MLTPFREGKSGFSVAMTAGLGFMATAGLLLMSLVGFTAANSQEGSQSLEISDEKLRAIAELYLDVLDIQEAYKTRIQMAQTPEEAQALQQEANQLSHDVVEQKDDVTVQEYSDTLRAAGEDDDLWERLVAHAQEIQRENAEEEPAEQGGQP